MKIFNYLSCIIAFLFVFFGIFSLPILSIMHYTFGVHINNNIFYCSAIYLYIIIILGNNY